MAIQLWAYASVLESLDRMELDYLDLMLLHQPFGDYYGAYHALEKLYKEGKLRAIGVSNFYPDRLSDIVAFNEITPQVDQVETHPLNQQIFAQENMIKNKVQIESWATFAEGRGDIFNNPKVLLINMVNPLHKSWFAGKFNGESFA